MKDKDRGRKKDKEGRRSRNDREKRTEDKVGQRSRTDRRRGRSEDKKKSKIQEK